MEAAPHGLAGRALKVLVVIPARGGSKGLPGKNLKPVGGIPLVGRAARIGREFVRRSGLDGVVLVDTDSEEIAAEARKWGAAVPFLRPANLGLDTTSMTENVLHAAERVGEVGAVVLLQPTSPLRSVEDVLGCWNMFDPPRFESVVAIVENDHIAEQTFRLGGDGILAWAWPDAEPDRRRQDLPRGFRPSGSVYISTLASLKSTGSFLVSGKSRGFVVPRERAIDVDSADDLAMAESIVSRAPITSMTIDGREIGEGKPCFVIAEAGVNHNGDVALAHRLIDCAADAGADAVKFQTFDPEKLVAKDAAMAEYQVANTGKTETQAEMLRRLVLPKPAHIELQKHARERGILFLSTPFDEDSADFLESLGMPAFKVPSGELTNHPFLSHLAAKKKPMLMSSGMADMAEVAAAVDVARAGGAPSLGLFHCVTSYPAAGADANLRAMASMRAAFGVPVGWSDHTGGITIALASVARGAQLLEKHFTLDRAMPGPDHKASLEPGELAALVRGVRAVEAALGDGIKRPRPAEIPLMAAARKSLHAARDLAAGDVVALRDLVSLRPGTGISPARLGEVVGRKLLRAVKSGARLSESDLG